MSKLAFEYQAFLRFMNTAKEKLIEWHGPHCNYDPLKIAVMAAREWDSMLRIEQKHFLLSARDEAVQPSMSGLRGAYCNYKKAKLLDMSAIAQQNSPDSKNSSSISTGASIADSWNKLKKSEQVHYAQVYLPSYFMTKVIEHRDHLHQLYDPRTLAFLEFIIKSHPLRPSSSYFWFLKLESQQGDDKASTSWRRMNDLDRSVYDHCAVLDKNRYKFERESLKARLMTLDPNEDNFELKDFMLTPSDCPSIETLGQMMKHSGATIKPPIKEKRPRMPFSLFIEDHRYAIRDKNPRFQFGEHLRLCSEAWAKLTEEEKKVYSDRSRKLQMDWKARWIEMPEDELPVANAIGPDMFSHRARGEGTPTKPSHLWSRIPSVKSFLLEYNNNLPEDSRKSLDQMSDNERELYFREYEGKKRALMEDKSRKVAKLVEVKALMKEARKLALIKRQLLLKCKSHKHEKNIDTLVDLLSQSNIIDVPSDEIASSSTAVKSQ